MSVEKQDEDRVLIDSYTRYVAAKELGLSEIEVEIVGESGESTTVTGSIQKIIENRGFGFIRSTEYEANIFFHMSALEGADFSDLEEGDTVKCEVEPGREGPQARVVQVL